MYPWRFPLNRLLAKTLRVINSAMKRFSNPNLILMSFPSVTILAFSTDLRLSKFGIYWAKEKLHDDCNFAKKKIIIILDEAHFHLGGYISEQNCHMRCSKNPHVILQKPMHKLRVTVDIVGSYFFENETLIAPDLYLLFVVLMGMMFDINGVVQLVTYLVPQSIYGTKR